MSRPDSPPPWHALSGADALAALETTERGLDDAEAARRLAEGGPNLLPEARRRGPLARFASQFDNVLIHVLIGAAVVTAVLGHWLDSGVILGVVVINAFIGFIQEGKAESALEAIRSLLTPRAAVVRGGRRLTVPAETLVAGDVVQIEPGTRIPADLRLLRARSLRIDEAVLTGESVPADKAADPVAADAPLGDRASLAFSGTMATYGQATGVVVATGRATEIGRVSELLARVEPLETPLIRQMAGFGRWLTYAIGALAAATFAIGSLVYGFGPTEMFLAAVGLAVAAIPEGLPAVMTITLAIGVQRMARRRAIIRRLPAVETLGAVAVVCADKTGTFTLNEMMVASLATSGEAFRVTGAGYAIEGAILLGDAPAPVEHMPALQALTLGAALCSDAALRHDGGTWTVEGDPMEGALLVAAAKAGIDVEAERRAWPRTDEIPFDSAHRFMATLHHDHAGNGVVYVKGAPERVLAMCAGERRGDGDIPLDAARWAARTAEMTARGERVLALAAMPTRADHRALRFEDVDAGLTLLGLFGLADPPRPEAIEAVTRCRAAGVAVKMITGDHAGTATAIAERLGLDHPDEVLTGAELDGMDAAALADRIESVDVFARTSPEHKLRLVEALQSRGHVSAMTGDGVNDAPALKRADIGIAMGRRGSDAAKEAAGMVLADDNFATIADAIEEGRTVYENIRKAIVYILPTSAGEAFTIVAAVLAGATLPITAVQILWVNMITAVTLGLSIAFEPPEAAVMRQPPRRPDEPLLTRFLVWRVAFVSLILVAGVFGVFEWSLAADTTIETARTAAVNTLVMFEVFYLFNVRRLHAPAHRAPLGRGARAVWVAVVAVVLFQIGFTHAPFMQVLFQTRDLTAEAWAVSVLVAATVFVIVEVEKALTARLGGGGAAGRRSP